MKHIDLTTETALYERQLSIEEQGAQAGRARYEAAVAAAAQMGRTAQLPPELAMVRRLVQPTVTAIEAWADDVRAGHARQFAMHVDLLDALDPYVCAYITLTILMNDAGRIQESTIAHKVASALQLEMEVNVVKAGLKRGGVVRIDKQGNPITTPVADGEEATPETSEGLWAWLATEKLKKMHTASTKAKRDFLRKWHDKCKALTTTDFTEKKLVLGKLLVTLAVEATGMWFRETTYDMSSGRKDAKGKPLPKTVVHLQPTPAFVEFIRGQHERIAELRPVLPLMVVAPPPWTSNSRGPYLSERLALELIKKPHKKPYIKQMEQTEAFKAVLRAVNALQESPWAINEKVYRVAVELFRSQVSVGVFPELRDIRVPELPAHLKEAKELKRKELQAARDAAVAEGRDPKVGTLKDWKRANPEYMKWAVEAAKAYEFNESVERANAIKTVAETLATAGQYVEEAAVYFPHQMCTRGRMYSVPSRISPQGDDLNKGLLYMAEGLELTERGGEVLAMMVANAWANDKIDKAPFDKRVEWTKENTHRILAVAADPMGTLDWWSTADLDKKTGRGGNAFQFLAACFEYAGYINAKREGKPFFCRIPGTADGSCNGLQHYGALLRCAKTGASVNLLPGETAADVYSDVARIAQDIVSRDLMSLDPEKAKFAQVFTGNIGRSFVKRPVMTTPYSVTSRGIDQQILEDVAKLLPHLAGRKKELMTYVVYARNVIQEALADAVAGARRGMDFLQLVARFAADEQVPIKWTTPDGFVVMQAYEKTTLKKVRTYLHGKTAVKPLVKTTEVVYELGENVTDEQREEIEEKAELMQLLAEAAGEKLTKEKAMDKAIEDAGVEAEKIHRDCISIQEPTGVLDKLKQAAGAGPNFIHSLDAAMLRMTVNRLADKGVKFFAMIHDSYGVHPNHYDLMQQTLREVFVEMHSQPLLEKFLAEVDETLTEEQSARLKEEVERIGGVPNIGTLDLTQVLQSQFFFA